MPIPALLLYADAFAPDYLQTNLDADPLEAIGYIKSQKINVDKKQPVQILDLINKFCKKYENEKHVVQIGCHGLKKIGQPRVLDLPCGQLKISDIKLHVNKKSLVIIDSCMSGHLASKDGSFSWITASRGYKMELSHGYLSKAIADFLTKKKWQPIEGNALANWYLIKSIWPELSEMGAWLAGKKWSYDKEYHSEEWHLRIIE